MLTQTPEEITRQQFRITAAQILKDRTYSSIGQQIEAADRLAKWLETGKIENANR